MSGRMLCVLLICLSLAAPGCVKSKAKKDPYDSVAVGMSEQEVVKLLGPPYKRMTLPREGSGGGTQVVYRWLGSHHLIHVSFVGGQVVGKQRS